VSALNGSLLLELAVILVAIGLGSFIKGVTGSGLPQIAIPVMATFLGVERAVVIMALPGVVTNTWLLWRYRSHLRATRDLPVLLATGITGAVIGTIGLQRANAAVLSLVLAGAIGLYLAVFVSKSQFEVTPAVSRFSSPPVGLVAGVLQGATGMSGPVLTTYLHGFRMPKQVFVVSLVTLFQIFAVAQMITLYRVGLYSGTRWVESVIALIPMMLILPLGARMADRLSAKSFERWILLLLTGTAVKLVYDGFSGLFG
jgi:uncharacterized protein